MSFSKPVGVVVAIVGLLIAALFVLADAVGLGRGPGTFGYSQVIGVVVGVLIFIAGTRLMR